MIRWTLPTGENAERRAIPRIAANPKILSLARPGVLRLFAQGHTLAEVVAIIGCKASTTLTHCKHIMAKLGLGTPAERLRRALAKGLVAPESPAPHCGIVVKDTSARSLPGRDHAGRWRR